MKNQIRVILAVGVFGALGLSGCSKSDGVRVFSQLPDPNPTTTFVPPPEPSPIPVPSPTMAPSPTPLPTASPTPNPTPSPIACSPSALQEFNHYGSFSLETGTYRGMDISHALAARTAKLDGVELGYGLHREVGRYDVIGEDVELAWTDVVSGGVAYGNQLKLRDGVDTYSLIKKARPIDFDAVKERLIEVQLKLVELPVNGVVSSPCNSSGSCTVTLKGSNPTVNRFTVTKQHLKKRVKLVIDVPKGATAVVVIDEQNIEMDDMELDVPNETIWTLSKRGGKFTIDFMSLRGTVVLLDSTFEMDRALLMGRVIAKEFTATECYGDRACSTIESGEMPAKICL
jgi:choice-of-anchor A domain-containing protein